MDNTPKKMNGSPVFHYVIPGFLFSLISAGSSGQVTSHYHLAQATWNADHHKVHLQFRESQRNYVFGVEGNSYRKYRRLLKRAIRTAQPIEIVRRTEADTAITTLNRTAN